MNLDILRQKLLDKDIEIVYQELLELFRHVDAIPTGHLSQMLESLFPVWSKLLQTTLSPQIVDNPINRCRKVLLQILNRLPSNERMRPYVTHLLHLLMDVLRRDNEENSLCALKTMFNLHRNYRPGLRDEVEIFLDFVKEVYQRMEQTTTIQFASPNVVASTNLTSFGSDDTVDDDSFKTLVDAPYRKDGDVGGQEAVNVSSPKVPSENSKKISNIFFRSMESFKTIAELPLIIMLLFQCYPTYIENYIPVLVPLMMSAISLQAPQDAARIYPDRYHDLLDSQVKTLSFVTYLQRGCADLMRPYQNTICESAVKLLIACPEDALLLRKDIFVATRHIISTEFRRGFYTQLDILMDDAVLMGKNSNSSAQIRPLAYSTLADMIHHVRDMLTLAQVGKIVDFYGKRIHDTRLPLSIQTTSIRLLLNLVDISAKNIEVDGWHGRNILSRILLVISAKFGSILSILPRAVLNDLHKPKDTNLDLHDGGAMEKLQVSSLLSKDTKKIIEHEVQLRQLLAPYSRQNDDDTICVEEPNLSDVKSLLKTMILGVRAVVWCAANYRNSDANEGSNPENNNLADTVMKSTFPEAALNMDIQPEVSSSYSGGSASLDEVIDTHSLSLSDDERHLIARVLQNGLRCFVLYTLSESSLAEEKQLLDHFAGAFTVLDATDFRDLFTNNFAQLYECILQDHAILTIPQHFLANANVSCWFAEILLNFLVAHMDELGVETEPNLSDIDRQQKLLSLESLTFEKMRFISPEHRASIIVRLFKIVFGSVTLYKSNEGALYPHLRTVIESCLQKATLTKHPDNYLLLLRALFRSISGGKYEIFYKEVLPILPGILSAIMRLQDNIQDIMLQEILLELCLTIPARLSSLLQYLPILMKSVIRAIHAQGELAYLGLRTFEFWVDNLNPDFLYPIMTSQDRLLTDIIQALETHLLPEPYPYGQLALRILGKLGGKNRQYLQDTRHFDIGRNSPHQSSIHLRLSWKHQQTSLKLDIMGSVLSAAQTLRRYYRKTPQQWKVAEVGFTSIIQVGEEDSDATAKLSTDNDEMTKVLEDETKKELLSSISYYKRQAFILISNLTNVVFDIENFTTFKDRVTSKAEIPCKYSKIHELLLETLTEAAADMDIREEANHLLDVLSTYFMQEAIVRAYREALDPEVIRDLQEEVNTTDQTSNPIGDSISHKKVQLWIGAVYGVPKLNHDDFLPGFHTFIRVILRTFGSSKQEVIFTGKRVLSNLIERGVKHFSSKQHFIQKAGGAVSIMCDIFCHTCYDRTDWRKSLAGAIGLRCLVELLDGVWCHENQLSIVRSLFFVLTTHPVEMTTVVQSEAGQALLAVITKAWDARHQPNDIFANPTQLARFHTCVALQDREILQCCVVELLSSHNASRMYAKKGIERISSLSHCSVSSLLHPYCQFIMNQAAKCHCHTLAQIRTGYVDALAYILALTPPILKMTEDLMGLLQDLWVIISEESVASNDSFNTLPRQDALAMHDGGDNGLHAVTNARLSASAHEYPFGLSQHNEAKVAAVKLLRAAFLAAPDELRKHPEACNRFVGIFFRHLIDQPLELVEAAQQALKDVIYLNKQNKDISLPKELLQQCLRPVLLNLADYRKLNLSLLDGLSRLLSLLSNCFNVTLGEKLLEHLKQWREPDRIIKAGIWKRGEEPLVAAAIINLFHLLPPNEAFLEPLVVCVIFLEDVMPQFGNFGKMSSPYRLPLTRFLSRYATLAAAFFLKQEQLVNLKFSSLFQHILKFDEAAPIRAVIIGDGGAEALIAATFATASKLSAATSAEMKTTDTSEEMKLHAQIHSNAQKAAAQAVATAQAQGMSTSAAEARGMQARAAYVARAHAQVNAQQAFKAQSHIQIQANAQKLHTQTLAAAQAQGMPVAEAQIKAQTASKDYITKAQSQAIQNVIPSHSLNPLVSQHQAQQLHALIQVNAQKVHAQTLAAAQERGLEPVQAQEKAKQAQASYVHQAKAQAQAKLARAHSAAPSPSAQDSFMSPSNPLLSRTQHDALELHHQGLRIIRTISKLHRKWLAFQPVLIDCLRKLWRAPARQQRVQNLGNLPIRYHSETKLLVKCFITYCRSKPEDTQALFDILSVFLHQSALDFSFVKRFFIDEVAVTYSPANRRNIVRMFLRMLRDPCVIEDLKVTAIQVLILPMFSATFADPNIQNTEVMDNETINWTLREILASKDQPTNAQQSLRIALLKLGTLLIQHMSKYVTDQRKEVIKFAWNHLKASNMTSKLWAYVNVCRFIAGYETPPKIVLQVYVALLRTHDIDSRYLVRKALDILLPVLPIRLPPNELIKAIKWTKKIAYEEGHTLDQLVHIWFLTVRHPALFYPFRGQFVPLMINSLNRLAVPPRSTPENRRLAVNIVDVIIAWEQVRRKRLDLRQSNSRNIPMVLPAGVKRDRAEEAQAEEVKKRKIDHAITVASTTMSCEVVSKIEDSEQEKSDSSGAVRPSQTEDDFELSAAMSDLILNFCLRFALASADKPETSRLSRTCGDLFDKAIRLWPSQAIRFSYFDKLIAVTAEAILRQTQALRGKSSASLDASASIAHLPSMPPFFDLPKGAPLASIAVLHAVLGILNSLVLPEIILKTSKPIPYILQHAPRVMKLLEPCFDRTNTVIQEHLTRFLKRVFPPTNAPVQLNTCGFYNWLRDILNERLMDVVHAHSGDGSKASTLATKRMKKPQDPTGNTHAPDPESADTSKMSSEQTSKSLTAEINAKPALDHANQSREALHVLRIMAAMADAAPSFVDSFVPLLLNLTKMFMRQHLLRQQSLAKTLNKTSGICRDYMSPSEAARPRVLATPSLVIVDEWNNLQCGRSKLLQQNVLGHSQKRNLSKDDKQKRNYMIHGSQELHTSKRCFEKANPNVFAPKGSLNKAPTTSSTTSAITQRKTIQVLMLCFRLLAKATFANSENRRLFVNLILHCLNNSSSVPLLLHVIKIVSTLLLSDVKQVLTSKDRSMLLTKMSTFHCVNEILSLPLQREYFELHLKLQEQVQSVDQSGPPSQCMLGLQAVDAKTRMKFINALIEGKDCDPGMCLQHILKQDWQLLGSRYWLTVGIEALLACLDLESSSVITKTCKTAPQEVHVESKHSITKNIIHAMCTLIHVDLRLADSLWTNLFSEIWPTLRKTDKLQTCPNLIRTVASKYNRRDLRISTTCREQDSPNSVTQSLLHGILSCPNDLPALTPELLTYLATTYGAWAPSLRICEYNVQNPGLSADSHLRWVEALDTLYKKLNENDWRVGLSLQNVHDARTASALYIEAAGGTHEAQDMYFKLLKDAQLEPQILESTSIFELRLWEDRWVECAKKLCQWTLMNDFAKSTQNQELLLDCAWKRGDWSGTKQLLSSTVQAVGDIGCPEIALQRLYIAVLDGDRKSNADAIMMQTAELALQQWHVMPRILGRSHIPLMHLFHKFVEMKESIQMMVDIKSTSQAHTLPNLKPAINIWRERLPNKYEDILLWDDILTWRTHMFQVVKSTFSWSDPQVLACMHDTPWAVIKLAHVARKQHLPDVCLGALSKLSSVPAMDVEDAFLKLREQVNICYESSTEYVGGLSILNNTNLHYFDSRQKAELFRLKGLFLNAIGNSQEANQTFSYCLQICETHGKGWLSWGNYCYHLFMIQKEVTMASQAIACYFQAIHHRCNSARSMIARVLWLLSMDDESGTLIQAFEQYGKQLPIWIWIVWIPQLLMALERPEASQIRGLFRGLAAKFPQAIYYTLRAYFLEHRENTLHSLQSAGADSFEEGKKKDARQTPGLEQTFGQAGGSKLLYAQTRTGHVVSFPANLAQAQVSRSLGPKITIKESVLSFGIPFSSALTWEEWNRRFVEKESDPGVDVATHVEELLNFLRRSHESLIFEMECMLEELIVQFRPGPEEELLSAVYALLMKCDQLPQHTRAEAAPRMLRATLSKVCRKFFILQPNQKNAQHEDLVARYKMSFEQDFMSDAMNDNGIEDGSQNHISLKEITRRLMNWKNLLQQRIKTHFEQKRKLAYLESCSRHLLQLSSTLIEVPGQYIADIEPIRDLHARILYFDNDVEIIMRNGYTHRRITMGGSDGRSFSFLVQYAMTHITRTDERMMQMYLLLNRFLRKHNQTIQKNVVFPVTKVIPLTPRVRLVDDSRDTITLEEIYQDYCAQQSQDPDLPLKLYWEDIDRATETTKLIERVDERRSKMREAKLNSFRSICRNHVPETILAKYVLKRTAHPDAYFQYRNEFTKHLALSSFITSSLVIGERSPCRFLLSATSGQLRSTEVRPLYASNGIVDETNAMPFRLTRNLVTFITPVGVNGPLTLGISSIAEALLGEQDILRNQLALFFRDDLVSWHLSKTKLAIAASSGPISSPPRALKHLDIQMQPRVQTNVDLVMTRFEGLSCRSEGNKGNKASKTVEELVKIAMDEENQQDLYPTWAPWI
uniref:Phosphatidylinositol kinase (PIKL3) putative n=1 Tax=Albugo laibachii Nc14 TaxID=890382 RepID=F0WGA0_9STRA|nr:phosphatidylinositol kinase (PIKL3) putative [Albugo laibachii Nc14]|eukprot:CCA20235.1 phosphatidylinositol kinase (PIKL3) putative [Albugo laibachii Nc14]